MDSKEQHFKSLRTSTLAWVVSAVLLSCSGGTVSNIPGNASGTASILAANQTINQRFSVQMIIALRTTIWVGSTFASAPMETMR
jgi:hypothetical protein